MRQQPILIVDDDEVVRDIVREVLALEGFLVLEAATGRAGLQAWEDHAPQLVILDIVMPQQNGLQVLEQIRRQADTPVIMLTRKASEDDKARAFELGADDYLSKPFSSRELALRVKAVLRRTGGRVVPDEPDSLTVGDLHLELSTRQVSVEGRPVPVSRTEFQILWELARQPGRILTRPQLLLAVWGPEYVDDKQILRCAVYRLRQKFELDPAQPMYLQGERNVGYWLTIPEEVAA
jgi:DNA-binding response OmpR family regulator